jgi:hypothetical protein
MTVPALARRMVEDTKILGHSYHSRVGTYQYIASGISSAISPAVFIKV